MADLLRAADPAQAAEEHLAALVDALTAKFASVDPPRIIEIARLACLPWSWVPVGGAEGGLARAELMALLALTASNSANAIGAAARTHGGFNPSRAYPGDLTPETSDDVAEPRQDTNPDVSSVTSELGNGTADHDVTDGSAEPSTQALTDMVSQALPNIDTLLHLAEIREVLRTEEMNALGMIAARMRGSEVWIRNSSYPDMIKTTLCELFADSLVRSTLRGELGFDADQAATVLESCHALQIQQLNDRMERMARGINAARLSIDPSAPDPTVIVEARREWNAAWDAETDAVTISVGDIATTTGLDDTIVAAVLDYFRLDVGAWTPRQAVEEFAGGNNPLRTHPIIRTPSGRAMLVHDAHVLTAIRENLEQYLKGTSVWERYQMARGDLLEVRTHAAFQRVLPSADTWDGFDYYVPADEAEATGDPNGYTKRVEGDHLIVQDDVAIIVEDKAVAISPKSRAGETRKLRRDLANIVRKASEQAARLQERIQWDGGIRLHEGGWLDLSHVREIHTVAVSLDDLPGVSTTTAQLVRAGLLGSEHIPWTVSLHDLDLITELVDLSAEFLLYLRRRRDPRATILYTAPDELDLFLYFFDAGLYVERDPDKVRELFPYMPEPTTAERRRYRKQAPAYLTTQTDRLDAWHYSTLASQVAAEGAGQNGAASEWSEAVGNGPQTHHVQAAAAESVAVPVVPVVPKPKMASSPLHDLIVSLQDRHSYGWLSIGATLLSGSAATQARMARNPADLLANPWGDGRERSMTIPFMSNLADSWLLVWMTRPTSRRPDEFEQRTRDYLRVKKHQLSLPRGVVLMYDEGTSEFVDVIYDGYVGELEPRLQEKLAYLKPTDHFDKPSHPDGKRRPGSSSPRGRKKKSRKKRR